MLGENFYMSVRVLRGAISVPQNTRLSILAATEELLRALVEANDIQPSSLVSVTFTATPDLDQAYPTEAARKMGWTEAALLCVQEMKVVNSLPMCLRVSILWETDRTQSEMRHCYLGEAADLRPDWS